MIATALLLLGSLVAPITPTVVPPSQTPNLGVTTPPYIQGVAPAVVGIDTKIPMDRPSVLTLGPVRSGSGVIVDPAGYVVTVGYILTDATIIRVRLRDSRVVPARLVGQDFESGIGVIKLDGVGPWPHAPLGNSSKVSAGDPVAIVGVNSENDLATTQGSIQEIKRFTGYWEYLLERAFIVAPPNPSFGGSPLVNVQGEIVGVTSLQLGSPPNVNLAIPIEYFTAAKDELFRDGYVKSRPPRPWLGLYTVETPRGLIIAGASPAGPAMNAGFQRGDAIVRLNAEKVDSQEDFYTKLWKTQVGQEITIVVLRESKFQTISVRSIDRRTPLRLPSN
jgi:S1-C subfamily serine protease